MIDIPGDHFSILRQVGFYVWSVFTKGSLICRAGWTGMPWWPA